MKKKSLLFFALALVLSLCFALTACGDKNGEVSKLTAESGITADGVFESGSALSSVRHSSDSELENAKSLFSGLAGEYETVMKALNQK